MGPLYCTPDALYSDGQFNVTSYKLIRCRMTVPCKVAKY